MNKKPHSNEAKKRISDKLKGRKLSSSTKLKMSESKKGHPFYGKRAYKMSEEAKANIRKGIIEKRNTEEYRRKLSETKKGELNHSAKLNWEKVREIRKEYIPRQVSQQLLAEKYGVSRSTIADIVNNRIWKVESPK